MATDKDDKQSSKASTGKAKTNSKTTTTKSSSSSNTSGVSKDEAQKVAEDEAKKAAGATATLNVDTAVAGGTVSNVIDDMIASGTLSGGISVAAMGTLHPSAAPGTPSIMGQGAMAPLPFSVQKRKDGVYMYHPVFLKNDGSEAKLGSDGWGKVEGASSKIYAVQEDKQEYCSNAGGYVQASGYPKFSLCTTAPSDSNSETTDTCGTVTSGSKITYKSLLVAHKDSTTKIWRSVVSGGIPVDNFSSATGASCTLFPFCIKDNKMYCPTWANPSDGSDNKLSTGEWYELTGSEVYAYKEEMYVGCPSTETDDAGNQTTVYSWALCKTSYGLCKAKQENSEADGDGSNGLDTCMKQKKIFEQVLVAKKSGDDWVPMVMGAIVEGAKGSGAAATTTPECCTTSGVSVYYTPSECTDTDGYTKINWCSSDSTVVCDVAGSTSINSYTWRPCIREEPGSCDQCPTKVYLDFIKVHPNGKDSTDITKGTVDLRGPAGPAGADGEAGTGVSGSTLEFNFLEDVMMSCTGLTFRRGTLKVYVPDGATATYTNKEVFKITGHWGQHQVCSSCDSSCS